MLTPRLRNRLQLGSMGFKRPRSQLRVRPDLAEGNVFQEHVNGAIQVSIHDVRTVGALKRLGLAYQPVQPTHSDSTSLWCSSHRRLGARSLARNSVVEGAP